MQIVVLVSTVFCVDCDWVEISKGAEQMAEHRLSIEHSMVPSESFVVKDLNRIQFEELADIIGPEFENEFPEFSKKHSHGVNATDGNETIIYVDPWLKYDREQTTAPFITPKQVWIDSGHRNVSINFGNKLTFIAPNDSLQRNAVTTAMTTTTTTALVTKATTAIPTTKPTRSTHTSQMEHVTISTTEKVSSKINHSRVAPDTNASTSKRLAASSKPLRKATRIKWAARNPFDFNEVMNYLRKIQNSFSMDANQGIGAKIEMLKTFKMRLMRNIGNFSCTCSVLAVDSVQ